MLPRTLSCLVLLVHGLSTAHCAQAENTVDSTQQDPDSPRYQVLEDGTVLRFTRKPPLYDITKGGTTTWYPCVAEVVRPGNTSNTTPNPPTVQVRWVIPESVPKLNHTGEDWPHLKGHGYFVDRHANNTLVLVHPEVSDEGRYICQAQLGEVSIKAHMQLHVLSYDRTSFLLRTAHGVLGVVLVLAVVGALWLLNRLVLSPYRQRKKMRRRMIPVIEDENLDEAQPSLQNAGV